MTEEHQRPRAKGCARATSTLPQCLANDHLRQRSPCAPQNSQWPLTSRYRIKEEATVESLSKYLRRAWSAPPNTWAPGRWRRVVQAPWPGQRLLLPHLLGRGWPLGWDQPWFWALFAPVPTHLGKQNIGWKLKQWSSVLKKRSPAQPGLFNLPSPKEGMWFFTEGNLKWTKVFSLQTAYNYYLGLRHCDNRLNLWKHNESKYLPSETKVSVNSRPAEVPISKEVT